MTAKGHVAEVQHVPFSLAAIIAEHGTERVEHYALDAELPSGLLTLLDIMRTLPAATLYHMAFMIGKITPDGNAAEREFLSRQLTDPEPSLKMLKWMSRFVDGLKDKSASGDLLRDLQRVLMRPERITELELAHRFDAISVTLENELRREIFFHVSPAKVARTLRGPWFGPDVVRRLPDVDRDIRAAFQCWMFDQPSACVFHLTRVVEGALKALVKLARVQNKINRVWPTWETYLTALHNKVNPPQPKKQGVKIRRMKPEDETFFGGATAAIRDISRAWRSRIVHEPGWGYSEPVATQILDHVEMFARHVVTRLPDKVPLPTDWPKADQKVE